MKRFLKWFFGILLFLIVVVVGLAIALPYIINPNEYKDEIIAQVKPHMLGRDLQIPGDIKISVLPWLGFEISKVVIGNADGFVLKPFMTIEKAKAHVKLLSLLTKTPEIGSLEFSGIQVNLQRDVEGRNNWSDLTTAKTPAKPAPTPSATTQAIAIPLLKIEGLHISDVTVWLEDKQAKDTLSLSHMNIDAGPIDQLNPVPISGKFNFHSKKSEVAAASAFALNLVLSNDTPEIVFDRLIMNTNVSGEIVSNNTIKTQLQIPALKLNLKKESIEAKPFYLKLNDMDSEGRFNMNHFDNPVVRLGWEIKKLDLDALLPAVQKKAAAAKPATEDIPQLQSIDTGEKTDKSANILAPLAVFGKSDLQGTLKVGQLRFNNLDFTDVKINLLARNGLVSALPEAKLYNGTYSGDVQIQMNQTPPRLRSKQTMRNVSLAPIVKALYGKDTLSGTMNFNGQYFSEGQSQAAITSHLYGDGQFNVQDTQLKTADIKQLLLGKWYDKVEFVQDKEEGKEVTAFDSMRGSITIKNGIAYNKDFSAISRRVQMRGDGFANLNNSELKYTLTTIPKKSLAFSYNGQSYDLKDRNIPTYITGTFSEPKIDSGVKDMLKDRLKEKVEEKEEQLKDKLKNLLSK